MIEWDADGAGPGQPELVVGGVFTAACGTPAVNLARINLQTYVATPFGTGANGAVRSLAVGPAGELVVGGGFSAINGVAAVGVAKYLGGVWTPYGTGVDTSAGGPVALLPRAGGELIVGGRIWSAGGVPLQCVARWNGTSWQALGTGLNHFDTSNHLGGVRSLVESPAGFTAVGLFQLPGLPFYGIAQWDGSQWIPQGSASFSQFLVPYAAALAPNGDLWTMGQDTAAGGIYVHRWNWNTWTFLPIPPGAAGTMTVTANGDVVVGGQGFVPTLSRWNGSNWQTIGTSMISAQYRAMAPTPSRGSSAFALGGTGITNVNAVSASSLLLHDSGTGWIGHSRSFAGTAPRLEAGPNGEIAVYRATSFGSTPIPGVGLWDGTTWAPIPQSPANVSAVAFDYSGGLLAASGSQVQRWTPAGWTTFPNPTIASISTLAAMPNGVIVVANSSVNQSGQYWNGTWNNLGASPVATAVHPDGRLIGVGVLGSFPVSSRVAAWDGSTWTNLDPNTTIGWYPSTVAVTRSGEIVIGGSFTFANRVARLVGTTWTPMGAGFNSDVSKLLTLADGTLVAIGTFTASGGVWCPGIAYWNGVLWQPFPLAPDTCLDATALPNGDFWTLNNARVVHRLTTPCPANAVEQGTQCSNTNTAGRLTSPAWPLVGGTAQSFVTGLPSNTFAVRVLGAPMAAVPLAPALPQAAAGCALQVTPDFLDATLTTAGYAMFSLSVPNVPSILGVAVAEQAVLLEMSGSNIAQVTSSNRITFLIGRRQ
jgi:hypothetical protein